MTPAPATWIIRFCYRLDASPGYHRAKRRAYDLLENPDSRLRPYFDVAMCALILATVALIIHEVRNPPTRFTLAFEDTVMHIFIAEYLARMWIWNDSHRIILDAWERAEFLGLRFRLLPALRSVLLHKWQYASSPLAIIDLLAILPSYRPLRVLRFFLLFRVFKLFRYTRSINEFARVLAEKRFELYTLAIFIGFVVFASATAIYIFEAHVETSHINTMFDAVYWSVITIFTVGYGDITPKTPEGKAVAMVLVVAGVAIISFSTSIVVNAFGEKMQLMRDRRLFAETEKLHDCLIVCGYGRVGEVVVDRLIAQERAFVIIDRHPKNVARARGLGLLAICDDAVRAELLERVGINRNASVVLCITGDDVTNLYITLTARQMNPHIRIVARANRSETAKKLRLAGADQVVMPYEVVGLMAAEYIHQPVATNALSGILSGERGMAMDVINAVPRSLLDGARLTELGLSSRRLTLFGVLEAAGSELRPALTVFDVGGRRFYFNPPGSFTLHAGDRLVVLGREMAIAHFREQVQASALHGRAA
ncbi:potassium channel family protein [Plasticicumulans acidivorans]|uniref:BK channel n=1 Tax=Plasticicumulans acidivorans TaxID=886464 RepID=A0A317MY42_9GAMM|nr:NAD-binding protein [Plasticicumulans acidivorans]PWV64535.1 voltage-gated potassium channel [Plasticicumulans acidivorans]